MALEEHKAKQYELAIHEIIAATVAQTLDLDKILDTALEKIMDFLGVKNGGVYLLNPQTNQLVLRRYKKLTESFIKEKNRVNMGEGCTGIAAKSGEIYCAFGMPEKQYICEDAERLMELDCFVAAPIMVKGKAIGVIELFAPSARRITKTEAMLITTISNQIGIAIENAKLYQQEKQNVSNLSSLKKELETANEELKEHLDREAYIARTLQRGLIPIEPPTLEGFDIATRYISATEAASIGGDFYDFVPFENTVGVIIGDVSGSGVETTTLSSMVKNTLRAFAFEDPAPCRVIARTNSVIFKEAPLDKFATVFLALLEPATGKVTYANAGHPPPFLVKTRGQAVEPLKFCTPALALTDNLTCPEYEAKLSKGDSFVAYTDGLTEAKHNSELFGDERLSNFLTVHKDIASADEMADEILNAIQSFSDGYFVDDATLVVIRRS